MTVWLWGFGWGDETIDPKTRRLMDLSMIGTLGKMAEQEILLKCALNKGVSVDEAKATIHIIGIYCGVPQALECFRSTEKISEIVGKTVMP